MNDQELPVLDEATYVKETAFALWEGLPWVILASFLFTLVSLPAVFVAVVLGLLIPGIILGIFTMGPGWAAMCSLIARSLLRDPRSFWDFFRAFGHFYLRGTVLGVFMAVPFVAAAWTLPALQQQPVPTIIWVGLGGDLAGVLFLMALYLYTVPQIVLYDVGVAVALRNSLVLAARYLSNTLGLLGLALLLILLAAKIGTILLVILPACWLVFVINNCRMVLRLELGDADDQTDSDNPG